MNETPFFIRLVKGWQRPERFDINLRMYTNRLYNLLSSLRFFGGCTSWMAWIFSRSRWIPLDVMTNPMNLSWLSPGKTWLGSSLVHVLAWCWILSSNLLCDCLCYDSSLQYCLHSILRSMLVEDRIHCPLICCPYILQSEGHHDVAIHPQWHFEGCMLFIFRIQFDLIVSKKFINKRHHLKTARVVNHDIRDRTGNSSLGQVTFRSQKSMQIWLFPFFLRTWMMLATNQGIVLS